jgi:putative DNA primase/helicase
MCPSHLDKEASLSIKYDRAKGTTMLKCHAGCETKDVAEAAGLKLSDLFDKPLKDKDNLNNKNETIYQYKDASGNIIFQKIRFAETEQKKKHFSQKRIINGSTVWGLDGGTYYETYSGGNNWSKKKRDNVKMKDFPPCEPIVYNLPELIEAIKQGKEVFIVEGEKDCENLKKWGLVATCNFDGASISTQKPKWRKEYNHYFKGAKVIIFNDNDDPGRAHADHIAVQLYEIAEYVKRVEIPGLEDKEDISDFITAGHTKEDLMNIVSNASLYEYDDAEDQSLITFNFSDVGNAERLMAIYGKNIKYSPIRTRWLIWSGKHWELDNAGKIELLTKNVIRKLQAEGNEITTEEHEKLKESIKKFVLRSETDGRVKAMINQAKTQRGATIFQTDLDLYKLNLKNGTLNLKTGLIENHDRKDFITKVINIDYDPKVQCPNWTEFINKIFLGDKELINYIQKSIGYSMTGDANLQCFYILHGNGSNGKGTFIKTIMTLLGDYAGTLNGKSLMEKIGDEGARGDLAVLEGTRFVSVNELEENKSFDESLMKSMSSGASEPIRVRRMYEEEFNLYPQFKIWLSTNKLPKIKGSDDGIWRRVRKIPFEHKFSGADKDVYFFENKLVPEMSGILNWAIEGCLKWQQEGMDLPEVVKIAVEEYKSDMDKLGGFITECCVVGERFRIGASQLYQAYETWCKDNGERSMTSTSFGKSIKNKKIDKKRAGIGFFYYGIGLNDNRDIEPDFEEKQLKILKM